MIPVVPSFSMFAITATVDTVANSSIPIIIHGIFLFNLFPPYLFFISNFNIDLWIILIGFV